MANFVSMEELFSKPQTAPRFLIEYLLPAGGLSFLVGKPKSGKSTLARQAILAVATGTAFLGFSSTQSSVLYYAIEERDCEVVRHFREMNLPHDAAIEIYMGAVDQDWLSVLRDKLAANPNIKLVVIDPILLAVNVRDANDYAPMLKALEPVRTVARDFAVAILCVHHSKKSQSADPGDNVLGSSAIRASADATWQVIKAGDGKRTFQTEMRYGKDLPPTNLIFDEDFRISQLGQSEAYVEMQKAAAVRERIEADIIKALTSNPWQTTQEILGAVVGKTTTKLEILEDLEQQGLLATMGGGVKGNPKRHAMTVPVEAEQNDAQFVEP